MKLMSQIFANELISARTYPPAVIFEQGMSLKEIEKSVILETLRRQQFNRTKTARILGIGIRTLQRKLKYYREVDESGLHKENIQ